MKLGRFGNLIVCFGLTLIMLGVSLDAAHAQTKIVQQLHPGTQRITKSGSYFLGTNINSTLTVGALIMVQANNVTLNLNGFTIKGPGTAGTGSGGIVVGPGFTGITIVNGTITGIAGTAISLNGSSTVSGMQIINNSGGGIACASSACEVTNSVITGNVGTGLSFSDTTSGYGLDVISGNGATVVNGTSLGNNVCNGSATCP